MPDRPFEFDLYRLNIVDDESLMDFMGKAIRTDADIAELIRHATHADHDFRIETDSATVMWSLREYDDDAAPAEQIIGVTLARSLMQQSGETVTNKGIERTIISTTPPAARTVRLFFRMSRHLVAVEHDSLILGTDAWREALHEIFDLAARDMEVRSSLRLEPVPQKEEILRTFRSFSKLTRLRVKLRIPNPELSRFTEQLKAEMERGGIREYLQDMKNPSGLYKGEGALPHASASLAQAGYKDGEVTMEGIREGKKRKVKTGRRAARGKLEKVRDFVRGMHKGAKSKETREATQAIIEEIDKLAEPPRGEKA